MVDIQMLDRPLRSETRLLEEPRTRRAIIVPAAIDHPFPDAVDAGWVSAPAQGTLWTRAFLEAGRPDALTATLEADGRPVLSLALVVTDRGMCRTAHFIGANHANGNFPLTDKSWLPNATADDLTALIDAVGEARPDIDLVALERLVPHIGDLPNPLLTLPSTVHEDVALSLRLDAGFDAIVGGKSGKNKRKKQRKRLNHYREAGGYRYIPAHTPGQVCSILDAFFAMKAARLRAAGIRDVFGAPETQAAFRQVFLESLEHPARPFRLVALEVAGAIRAVIGLSVRGRDIVCEFGAISQDELSRASPGEFLFYESIRESAEAGFERYDFSVGDEPYKRQWCDTETWLHDVRVALTPCGHAHLAAFAPVSRLRSAVKRSMMLRGIYRNIRRTVSGRDEAAGD